MLDDRKLEVLRAIVEDFVSTTEPVGSKALAERHSLGVSPATVRTHASRAMTKLHARDRAQLVVFAYQSGLV